MTSPKTSTLPCPPLKPPPSSCGRKRSTTPSAHSTEHERRVLQLRFGIEDGRSRTLEEVGREFGVTRERIRQIESRALRKLRHPSRGKTLKDFLD